MPSIRIVTEIGAPPAVCFDLARSVDAHVESAGRTRERAVAGVTSGLLGPGDEVTWRARHFGVVQQLTSRITAFERPKYFRDTMVRGAFAHLDHDHLFEATSSGTRMVDVFDYSAPYGPLGWVAERLFLTAYMTRFLRERAQVLKRLAESGEWRRLLV
ncbi:MAG TPA: SRPBCC family protein [Methylomirabilota bacterium]|nr:SRPBCC family protein [Methylomirabilota bacterium]